MNILLENSNFGDAYHLMLAFEFIFRMYLLEL